jgi:ABC-type lipoprotein release transport system permease subunit
VGIVHTGDSGLDGSRAVAHITDTRRLLGLDDSAHELAIRVAHPKAVNTVAQRLSQAADFGKLEVRSWQELRPDVVAMVQTNGVLTALLVSIIVAVSAIGVADTILMAVFERRRELGMLKAIGMRPASILWMVTAETLLLGFGASLAGLALGVGIDLYLARYGIALTSLSGFSMAGAAIPPVLHANLTLMGVLFPLGAMLGMALLAALWPAWVAARTSPVIAMRDR